jgi:type VI secretion system protein VasJ
MIGGPVDLGLAAPLVGANPVGRDLTYDPSFEALQAEVNKATGLAGHAVDWRRVQQDCVRLLRDEAKDLRCASWLVLAMSHVEGWTGTLKGLAIYRAILEAHWDAMYPPAKRTRARVAIVEWVWESLRQSLSSRDVSASDGEEVRAILIELKGLEEVLASKLGDLSPGAGPLRSVLRDKAASVPEIVAAPPAPVPVAPPLATSAMGVDPATPGAPSAPRVPAPQAARAPVEDVKPVDFSSPEDVGRLVSGWRDGLFSLSRAERATDPAAARPYRFARLGAWLLIDGSPDVEGARTFIRPPRAAEARALRELFDRGDWASVRDTAEDLLAEHVFWLDINRFTFVALEKLGPSFAKARMAIMSETVTFLDRVPNLESLCFKDGTPFADGDTLAWLRAERARRAPASSKVGANGADDPLVAILSSARFRCAEGQVTAALAGALSEAGALAAARSRFQTRLALAKLAVERGSKQVGVAILEQLLIEIDETLEAWEPELCANAIRDFLAVSAYREGERERHIVERQDLLFRRLLRLNPASALQLVK